MIKLARCIAVTCKHKPSGGTVVIEPFLTLWINAKNGDAGARGSILQYHVIKKLRETYPKTNFPFIHWTDVEFSPGAEFDLTPKQMVAAARAPRSPISVNALGTPDGNPNCRCDDPKASRCPVHDR